MRFDKLKEGAYFLTIEKNVSSLDEEMYFYLKVTDKKLGLLINFNVLRLIDGFERFVNPHCRFYTQKTEKSVNNPLIY